MTGPMPISIEQRPVSGATFLGVVVSHGEGAMGARVGEVVGCLVHNEGDDVAVAVRDLEAGPVSVAWLDSGRRASVEVRGPVPLGHKVALRALEEGDPVIEYGVQIGVTRTAVASGDHVHTHNLRSARWQRSA
jgi:(2R)-sulfolactate sulfo-lyase subunit alpha